MESGLEEKLGGKAWNLVRRVVSFHFSRVFFSTVYEAENNFLGKVELNHATNTFVAPEGSL